MRGGRHARGAPRRRRRAAATAQPPSPPPLTAYKPIIGRVATGFLDPLRLPLAMVGLVQPVVGMCESLAGRRDHGAAAVGGPVAVADDGNPVHARGARIAPRPPRPIRGDAEPVPACPSFATGEHARGDHLRGGHVHRHRRDRRRLRRRPRRAARTSSRHAKGARDDGATGNPGARAVSLPRRARRLLSARK